MAKTIQQKREKKINSARRWFTGFSIVAGIFGAAALGLGAFAISKGGIALLMGPAFKLVAGVGCITAANLVGALISRKVLKNRIMEYSTSAPKLGTERVVDHSRDNQRVRQNQTSQQVSAQHEGGRVSEELSGEISVGAVVDSVKPKIRVSSKATNVSRDDREM